MPNSPLSLHIAATIQAQIGMPGTAAPIASIIDSELAGTQTPRVVELIEELHSWLDREGRGLVALLGEEDTTPGSVAESLENLIVRIENVRAGWGKH